MYFISVDKRLITSSRSRDPNRSWFRIWYNRFKYGRSYLQQLCDEFDSFEELQASLGSGQVDGFDMNNKDVCLVQTIIKFNPEFNKNRLFGYVFFHR